MKRALAIAAASGMLAFGVAPAASAGEVTGSTQPRAPKSTPVQDYVAASLCAFSGLEDYSEGQPVPESGPRAVQNWGAIPKQFRPADEHPGIMCKFRLPS